MSQTKEDVEAELSAFKAANPNWMTDPAVFALVASYNVRLANFPSKPQYYRSYLFHMTLLFPLSLLMLEYNYFAIFVL